MPEPLAAWARVTCSEAKDALDARSGVVQMPFILRNWVREGDIIIVSKGNGLFRAIGEFTGGYEFAPRPGGGYAHRRAVRWLWIDREGVPVGEIYSRRFSMKSIYLLYDAELNVPALERYMNSQQQEGPTDPEPFVLVIDEISLLVATMDVTGSSHTYAEALKHLIQGVLREHELA